MRYLRLAALGDSTTAGIGDPVPTGVSATGWRGWSRLLVEALATTYDVSACQLAVSGATARDVVATQLDQAVAHRPDLASLVVGVNDTMRSSWDPGRFRGELLTCADALTGIGAHLLTVRFHDHGAVFNLPTVLRRPLTARLDAVNAVYDEIHQTYGGVRVDLASMSEITDRRSWSVDRLHPSERGHRSLAAAFAIELGALGLEIGPLDVDLVDGLPPTWRREVAWVLTEGGPWVGRRARDLGPVAVQLAWDRARRDRAPAHLSG